MAKNVTNVTLIITKVSKYEPKFDFEDFEENRDEKMTNEEAINDLKEFWNWFCYNYPDSPYADLRIDYAFSMAFDALERCEDVEPYLAQWSEVEE